MGNDDRTTTTVRIPARIDFAGGWSDVHYFSMYEGGAVLNAAIWPGVEGSVGWDDQGLHLEYTTSLPPGSHLGSSASIDVAWLALTNGLTGQQQSAVELAETAYRLEKLLGTEGGKQDQYAAALGGINLLRFGAENAPATVEPLDIPANTMHELAERCVLCFTGKPPTAGKLHEQVWARYRTGDATIATTLRLIRDSAVQARDALLEGDLAELARILTINRMAAQRLHRDTVTAHMDDLFQAGEASGALGAKQCGEGGGGCLLFICKAGKRSVVQEALRARGTRLIPFEFAPPSLRE